MYQFSLHNRKLRGHALYSVIEATLVDTDSPGSDLNGLKKPKDAPVACGILAPGALQSQTSGVYNYPHVVDHTCKEACHELVKVRHGGG
jgi:hypothetical protein